MVSENLYFQYYVYNIKYKLKKKEEDRMESQKKEKRSERKNANLFPLANYQKIQIAANRYHKNICFYILFKANKRKMRRKTIQKKVKR